MAAHQAPPSLGFSKQEYWSGLPFPWKWNVKVKSLRRVRLLATPWTAAYQAPPSMGFSRHKYWSGVPLPSPLVDSNLLKIKWEARWNGNIFPHSQQIQVTGFLLLFLNVFKYASHIFGRKANKWVCWAESLSFYECLLFSIPRLLSCKKIYHKFMCCCC